MGSRTRNYADRNLRNTTIPSDQDGGSSPAAADPYYLIPIQDDWRRRTTTPPAALTAGDRYIVPLGGSGDWASHSGELAEWDGAVWAFSECEPGATAAVLKEKDRCQLVDFNQADVMLMLTTSSADCVAWVPDSVLDQLEGPYNGLVADISPDPVAGGGPWSQYIVSAPSTWPTAAGGVADVGSIAMLVVDQSTNTAAWVYRNPEVQPSITTGTAKGSLAYLQDIDKYVYYDHDQTGLSSTHWCLLGSNISVEELANVNATLGAGVDGYSLTYDDATATFVLTAMGGAVVVPTKLMELTGDVNVADDIASDKFFLQWDWNTTMWIGKALVLGDIGQSGATDGQVPKWDDIANSWIPVTPAGGTVPTKLMELVGDVNVGDVIGDNGKYLKWNWATKMWVASQIVLADIGQSGATDGQVATYITGSGWVPRTPAGGWVFTGVSYRKSTVTLPETTNLWWNVGWGGGPLYAAPAGVAYVLLIVNMSVPYRPAPCPALNCILTHRNSLGVSIGTYTLGAPDGYCNGGVYPLQWTTPGSLYMSAITVMSPGDYFTYYTTNTQITLDLQMMKVG